PERAGQEGRRGARRDRAHREGDRAAGWQLHPVRRERGGAHQQPGQPARHPDLRPGRARAPGTELHEDRVPGAGGAVMTERSIVHRTKVPEIRKGDVVVVLSGRDAGKRGKVEQVIRRDPSPTSARSGYRRVSSKGGVSVVVEGLNVARKHT